MAEPLKIFDSKDPRALAALAIAVICALAFVWFGVKWQLGNMLAELTSPAEADARNVAELATGLSPRDPMAAWLAARTEKDIFTPEKIEASVRLHENVVRLSPNDYRYWVELGRSYEQADAPERAEAALRRAIELAPNYAYAHWQLGNFFLRQGRAEDAIAELRRSTENNVTYRQQVFWTAWQYFGQDPARVEETASDKPDVNAGLAMFYAEQGRPADALRVWNQLSPEEKSRFRLPASTITRYLHDHRYFREALAFSQELGMDPGSMPEAITNPGFEDFIGEAEDTHFGWNIYRDETRLDITPDTAEKRTGSRSLRLSFRNYTKPAVLNVLQVVVVEPQRRYRVSFWVRTDELKSAGPPTVEIINGEDDKLIASSNPIPTGTNDWQEMNVEFTAPEGCDAVYIRTARAFCGDACPLIGTVWYDDFSIQKM